MTRVLFGDPAEKQDPVSKSFFAIEWETVPMASLRMGFNDFVEMTQDISGEALESLDKVLAENGAYTLTQARDQGFRRAMQLLTFSKVKKETDAYLLKGIIDSGDSRFTDEQLARMESLLGTYVQS